MQADIQMLHDVRSHCILHLTSEILLNAELQAKALHKAPVAAQATHDSAQRMCIPVITVLLSLALTTLKRALGQMP